MTIAATILSQLGGRKFTVMTGAKNLLNGENYLQFDLPRGAKNKATKVQIALGADDTYAVKFFRWNAKAFDLVALGTIGGVYASELRAVFTAETGLHCSL